jgi:hypothetical protein
VIVQQLFAGARGPIEDVQVQRLRLQAAEPVLDDVGCLENASDEAHKSRVGLARAGVEHGQQRDLAETIRGPLHQPEFFGQCWRVGSQSVGHGSAAATARIEVETNHPALHNQRVDELGGEVLALVRGTLRLVGTPFENETAVKAGLELVAVLRLDAWGPLQRPDAGIGGKQSRRQLGEAVLVKLVESGDFEKCTQGMEGGKIGFQLPPNRGHGVFGQDPKCLTISLFFLAAALVKQGSAQQHAADDSGEDQAARRWFHKVREAWTVVRLAAPNVPVI